MYVCGITGVAVWEWLCSVLMAPSPLSSLCLVTLCPHLPLCCHPCPAPPPPPPHDQFEIQTLSSLRSPHDAPPKSFGYIPPSVSSVTPNIGSASGLEVTITGDNFGADPGFSSCTPLTNVTLNSGSGSVCCPWSFWNHTTIVCRTATGNSVSQVVVAVAGLTLNSSAEAVNFTYHQPIVRSSSPHVGNTTGGDLLTVSGVYFGTGAVQVFIVPNGSAPLECTGVSPVETRNGVDTVTCLSPVGAGRNHSLRIVNVGFSTPAPPDITFSYNPPVVTHVTSMSEAFPQYYPPAYVNFQPYQKSHRPPRTFPSKNYTFTDVANNSFNPLLLLVTGYNLAESSVVTVGGNPCPVASPVFLNSTAAAQPGGVPTFAPRHYSIVCFAPDEGPQGLTNVVVTASGQTSAPFVGFEYDPPVVLSVSPPVMDAALNNSKYLNVLGYNFGTFSSQNLTAFLCKNATCSSRLTCTYGDTPYPSLNPYTAGSDPQQMIMCQFNFTGDLLVGAHKINVVRLGKESILSGGFNGNVTAECQRDYYGKENETCTLCRSVPELVGAKCDGGGRDPYPAFGYSRVSRLVMVQCSPPEACLGGIGVDADHPNCATGYAQAHCRCAYRTDVGGGGVLSALFVVVHVSPGVCVGMGGGGLVVQQGSCQRWHCLSHPRMPPPPQLVRSSTTVWRASATSAPTWLG
jgi:hypothetical protein